MKNSRAIAIFGILFLITGILVCVYFPREPKKNPNAVLKIGAGDDISGMLMEDTAAGLKANYQVEGQTESTSFQDCCSNSAQWALNAREINIGFYCSHIAAYTVKQNRDVMIYGPAVMNAEIICFKKDWEDVKKVGVTQGRQQLKEISGKTYPQIEKFEEITQKGIMYTVEDSQVDAAILDITKAAGLKGYQFTPLSDMDYISYTMVVDKKFAKTEAFRDFLRSYNKVADRLNDRDYLADRLNVKEDSPLLEQVKFLSMDINEE